MTACFAISYETLDKSLLTCGPSVFICKIIGKIVWFLISTSCLKFSELYEMYWEIVHF